MLNVTSVHYTDSGWQSAPGGNDDDSSSQSFRVYYPQYEISLELDIKCSIEILGSIAQLLATSPIIPHNWVNYVPKHFPQQ
jgi:hypothetical protein